MSWLRQWFLKKRIERELALLPWNSFQGPEADGVLDVAIIGGGQSGLGLCFALRKQKIRNVRIYDRAAEGEEGPWSTTARMRILRTTKEHPGPALDFPLLTFQSWYAARYGNPKNIEKVPTPLWAEYLLWFRRMLDLPVNNGWELQEISAEKGLLTLHFNEGRVVRARKLVLATGRDGFGGFEIPSFAHSLPKSHWFHTGERIDPRLFAGKRVAVVGAAASAFDVSAVALEQGAKTVAMLMRRAELPDRNPLSQFSFWESFSSLGDQHRLEFYERARTKGTVVPAESIARLEGWGNFERLTETVVERAFYDGEIVLETNKGTIKADLLLFGTGYKIDGASVPALKGLAEHIQLWKDRIPNISPKMGAYPYLGSYFEFQEKERGAAPHLKQIHCFNYGAFLSQGRIAGDIDQLPIGLERLAEGIGIQLFLGWDKRYGSFSNGSLL